jgi:hypothetical protein
MTPTKPTPGYYGVLVKIVIALVSTLTIVFMTTMGYVSGQATSAHNAAEATATLHLQDMSKVRSRISTTETYQREVLRRLESIEQKLDSTGGGE